MTDPTDRIKALESDLYDLRWLVGHIAVNGISMLPPRLVPVVADAARTFDPSRFTVISVDPLVALGAPVPGGGEPQPTTVPAGTDCEAPDPDGITYGCRRPPGHDGSHQGYYRVDGRPLYWRKRDVRSAGGGDQPDTPCPHCGGTRVVMTRRAEAIGTSFRSGPCPGCTPSPEEGTP